MRRLFLVTLSALAAFPLAAQNGGRSLTLTLDEALAIAKRSNPLYLESMDTRRETGLGVRSARGALFPQVSSSFGVSWREGKQTFIEGTAFGSSSNILGSSYGIGVGVTYSVQSWLQPKAAEARLDAADANVTQQLRTLRLQVTTLYFNAVQAIKTADLEDSLVNSQRVQLSLAQAKERVGSGTPLDTKRAEVSLQQAQIAALTAHNAADVSKLQLFEQLGTPLQGDVTLTTDLPVVEPTFKADDLMADAKTHNATLAGDLANERALAVGKQQAMGQYVPSFQLSTGLGGQTSMNTDATGAARTWPFSFDRNPVTFSAGLSLPIWNGYQREQNTETTALQLNSARLETRRAELNLTTTIGSGVKQLELDWKTVQLQTQSVATAREALALAQERYRVGSIAFLDLSTAQDQYQTAENQRLIAIYTYHRDFATLEAAVGRPLR